MGVPPSTLQQNPKYGTVQVPYQPTDADSGFGNFRSNIPSANQIEYLRSTSNHPILRGLAGAALGAAISGGIADNQGYNAGPAAILGALLGGGAGVAGNAYKNQRYDQNLNYQLQQATLSNQAFDKKMGATQDQINQLRYVNGLDTTLGPADVSSATNISGLKTLEERNAELLKQAGIPLTAYNQQAMLNDYQTRGDNLKPEAVPLLDSGTTLPNNPLPDTSGTPDQAALPNTGELETPKTYQASVRETAPLPPHRDMSFLFAPDSGYHVDPSQMANLAKSGTDTGQAPYENQRNVAQTTQANSQAALNDMRTQWYPKEAQARINSDNSQAHRNMQPSTFQMQDQQLQGLVDSGALSSEDAQVVQTGRVTGRYGKNEVRIYNPDVQPYVRSGNLKVGNDGNAYLFGDVNGKRTVIRKVPLDSISRPYNFGNTDALALPVGN